MVSRFAFVGFRHPHVRDMFQRCTVRSDIQIVACCEEDAVTRGELAKEGAVQVTHDSFQSVLDEVECDVVAIGDVYARRGQLAERALQAGKHVISDKPLCISLDELGRIESLAAAQARKVGVMLDMRDLPVFRGIRDAMQSGKIGELRAMSFDGQHPLLRGKRPEWYLQPGMHGGTLNDIAVHAVDLIPWATGLTIDEIVAARCWSGRTFDAPHFEECGQAMLRLSNGAGVVCDVSYLTPDSFAYQFPHYWRFCLWGDDGALVAALNDDRLSLFRNGQQEVERIDLPDGAPGGYLDAFLAEIGGASDMDLTSAQALASSRVCLQIQHAADENLAHLEID